ncbi:MAG: phosphatidate cytidylyltransferase [Nitrososphaerales archaeon]|jgi:dolichol kinase
MLEADFLTNSALLLVCYAYVLLVIAVSGKLDSFGVSRKLARKFLHMMIGNLPFLIPFFTFNSFPMNFPFFVAAPFMLVTFLATPYSPLKGLGRRLRGLSGITEQGHQLGLVFYAFSYTVLAFFFAAKPYVIAAGILPMAYGDASASIVGERYGKRRYRILADKSLAGSAAMVAVSFLSVSVSLLFFHLFYSFALSALLLAALGSALVAAAAEGLTPLGFDNVTVPLLSAFAFLLLSGVA